LTADIWYGGLPSKALYDCIYRHLTTRKFKPLSI